MGLCPRSDYKSMKFIVSSSVQDNFHEYTIQCNSVSQRLRNNQLVAGHTFGKICCHKDDTDFVFLFQIITLLATRILSTKYITMYASIYRRT